jgi:hypothetical protein
MSTAWLRVYYLLAGISTAAFLLLLMAPLDESSVKNTDSKPLVKEFGDMLRTCHSSACPGFYYQRFLLCTHRTEHYELVTYIQ